MSTDRELLELAAKAAGIESGGGLFWCPATGNAWNPLTDDGDALRLAVKLELSIVFRNEAVFINNGPGLSFDTLDPAAATRKQIVRAAATIGRAMP